MLNWLVTRVRFYGAITLVALYAVCAVLPSVAWSFPRGGTSSHCLTGERHGVSDVHHGIHTPGDGAIGKHTDNSMEGGDGKLKCHAGPCCGLFCCAAITGDSGATVVQPVHASLLFGALDERLDGHGPKCIGRPPKPFLSL
ncbi:MAG: hypothetical protein M3Z96_06365 [Pseudomonadota bacterium]|nr:hypothetical protein [Pseudomonadota bacterium]